jgi:hypothetical protein
MEMLVQEERGHGLVFPIEALYQTCLIVQEKN